jgi:hypothetical protein
MLRLIKGGKPRRIYGQWLDREMHTAFTQITGADGTVPSEAIYDIRRDRQHPWRVLARRLAEAHRADAPKEQVKAIVRVLDLFVDELYKSPGGNAA